MITMVELPSGDEKINTHILLCIEERLKTVNYMIIKYYTNST